VGWVVVAPRTEGAVVVVVPPTVAGAWAVAGPVVVVGPLTARRPGYVLVEGGGVVVGSRGAVVVVDADVGAGLGGIVGSATPGARRGGSGWGSRLAEATRAARTAVVSPKTNSSSLQGRRGLAKCRGGGVGMVHRPGSAGSSGFLGVPASRPLTGRIGRSCAQRIERYVPASLTVVSPHRRPAGLLLGGCPCAAACAFEWWWPPANARREKARTTHHPDAAAETLVTGRRPDRTSNSTMGNVITAAVST
jgi:hypothetical protein